MNRNIWIRTSKKLNVLDKSIRNEWLKIPSLKKTTSTLKSADFNIPLNFQNDSTPIHPLLVKFYIPASHLHSVEKKGFSPVSQITV